MSERSNYTAKVKLFDIETNQKEWYDEGPADEVLVSAFKYLKNKEGPSVLKRLIRYMIEDWKAFDKLMTPLFFRGKKNG